jgi:hypothetical protein
MATRIISSIVSGICNDDIMVNSYCSKQSKLTVKIVLQKRALPAVDSNNFVKCEEIASLAGVASVASARRKQGGRLCCDPENGASVADNTSFFIAAYMLPFPS